MNASAKLRELRAEYELLDAGRPGRYTWDQHRSLLFYRAEKGNLKGQPIPPDTPYRASRWLKDLHDLERFIHEFGRMPRENNRLPREQISERERHLAGWIRTQRQATTEGLRCTYQVRRLECVDSYSLAPRRDGWAELLAEYRQFLGDNGRAPKTNSGNRTELRLARWANKRRFNYRKGSLTQAQIGDLESLPIWTWGRERDRDS